MQFTVMTEKLRKALQSLQIKQQVLHDDMADLLRLSIEVNDALQITSCLKSELNFEKQTLKMCMFT